MEAMYRLPATPRQIAALCEILPLEHHANIQRLTADEAHFLLSRNKQLWRNTPVTERQEHYLRSHGLWRDGLTRGTASELIAAAKAQESLPEHLERLP